MISSAELTQQAVHINVGPPFVPAVPRDGQVMEMALAVDKVCRIWRVARARSKGRVAALTQRVCMQE